MVVTQMSAWIDDENDEDRMQIADTSEVLMTPMSLTDFTDSSFEKMISFKLHDLFLSFDEIAEDVKVNNLFRVRFCIFRVEPEDAREMVQAHCPNCLVDISCATFEENIKEFCSTCQVECDLVYRV